MSRQGKFWTQINAIPINVNHYNGMICFFPMVIQSLAGLSAADSEMLAFYRAMGMSRRQLFTMVRLPLALPYFFGGLRVSAAYSVMGAVITVASPLPANTNSTFSP